MHRCSNHVGCLSASANRIGNGIVANALKTGDSITAYAHQSYKSIKASALLLNAELQVLTNRLSKGLIVDCSIVCTVNKDSYLYVSPTFVWLTPDMLSSGEFDIKSNTSWNID